MYKSDWELGKKYDCFDPSFSLDSKCKEISVQVEVTSSTTDVHKSRQLNHLSFMKFALFIIFINKTDQKVPLLKLNIERHHV